jgi:anaerobic carbon-monoxide dehydrogenase iron sulfur subunit
MLEPNKTIVLDAQRCTGCKVCQAVCSAAKEPGFNLGKARLRIEPDGPTSFRLRVCRLCEVPACAEACPTHAVEVADGLGIVVIDARDCTGCGACVRACPYGALSQWPRRSVPVCCDFCTGRPECVRSCPTDALAYGRRLAGDDR